jgi:GT2 family glycosyltransferase
MKTLLGIVSYGNLPFLKIAVRSVLETATKPIDVGVVVAKPRDFDMIDWLKDQPVKHIVNHYNKGFCGSLNDLLDAAFVNGHYDSIIVMGNDVVPYPGAIDAMIE